MGFCILEGGPLDLVAWDYLVAGSTAGVIEFAVGVGAATDGITGFVHNAVAHRRDFAILGWRTWMLEDPPVHTSGFVLTLFPLLCFSLVTLRLRWMVLRSF